MVAAAAAAAVECSDSRCAPSFILSLHSPSLRPFILESDYIIIIIIATSIHSLKHILSSTVSNKQNISISSSAQTQKIAYLNQSCQLEIKKKVH